MAGAKRSVLANAAAYPRDSQLSCHLIFNGMRNGYGPVCQRDTILESVHVCVTGAPSAGGNLEIKYVLPGESVQTQGVVIATITQAAMVDKGQINIDGVTANTTFDDTKNIIPAGAALCFNFVTAAVTTTGNLMVQYRIRTAGFTA